MKSQQSSSAINQTAQVAQNTQAVLGNYRFVDKNITETLYRVQSYDIHQKKLERIREEMDKNRLKGMTMDEQYSTLKSQVMNNKLKSHEFMEQEKIHEIKKSNQILLEKLLDISKGKKCAVKQDRSKLEGQNNKSLHYSLKRKEAERIDKENHKIMERIVSQGPMLSAKQMAKDYQQTLNYKRSKGKSQTAISVEKVLEKRRKFMEDAQSSVFPSLGKNIKLEHSPQGADSGSRNNAGSHQHDSAKKRGNSGRSYFNNMSQDQEALNGSALDSQKSKAHSKSRYISSYDNVLNQDYNNHQQYPVINQTVISNQKPFISKKTGPLQLKGINAINIGSNGFKSALTSYENSATNQSMIIRKSNTKSVHQINSESNVTSFKQNKLDAGSLMKQKTTVQKPVTDRFQTNLVARKTTQKRVSSILETVENQIEESKNKANIQDSTNIIQNNKDKSEKAQIQEQPNSNQNIQDEALLVVDENNKLKDLEKSDIQNENKELLEIKLDQNKMDGEEEDLEEDYEEEFSQNLSKNNSKDQVLEQSTQQFHNEDIGNLQSDIQYETKLKQPTDQIKDDYDDDFENE